MNDTIFQRMSHTKDQVLASLVNEILSSEYFALALEKIIHTGGSIDSHIQQTLNTFRVASKREVEDIEERLVRLERKLERVIVALEEMKKQKNTKGKKQKNRSTLQPGTCKQCGKKFTRKSYNQKFCSAACRSNSFSAKNT